MESNQKTILNIWQLVTLLNEMYGTYAPEARTQVYTQCLQEHCPILQAELADSRGSIQIKVVTTGKLM